MPIAQNHVPAHGRDNFLEKNFVCTALKGLDAEQRARALDVAAAYKRRFTDKEWNGALERIRRVMAEEEDQKESSDLTLLPPAPITPLGRPLPATTASSPVIPLATLPLRAPFSRPTPPSLTRINTTITSSPLSQISTPRTRWDIISCGPITPLSPTPVGNAFAGDGFWSSLTPKLGTPITALHHEPFSPVVPSDPEGRAAYDRVKSDIDTLARGLCATRLNHRVSFGEDRFFPKSLIKSRDELLAAQVAVQMRQLDYKKVVKLDLMDKLAEYVDEEKRLGETYAERCSTELKEKEKEEDLNLFSHGNVTSMVDIRAEKLVALHRRKSSLLALPDGALELAWATRILEDTEHLVAMRDDESSTCSDEDEGYDYSNFIRSIKREVSSTSTVESLTSKSEELDGRTNEKRSSLSPKKGARLSLRQSWSPNKPIAIVLTQQPTTGSPSNRNKTDISFRSLVSRSESPELCGITSQPHIPLPTNTPTLSTKETRHRAPNIHELSTWARELAKLDNSDLSPSPTQCYHPTLCSESQEPFSTPTPTATATATTAPSPPSQPHSPTQSQPQSPTPLTRNHTIPPSSPPPLPPKSTARQSHRPPLSPWNLQKQHQENTFLTGADPIPLPKSPSLFS